VVVFVLFRQQLSVTGLFLRRRPKRRATEATAA